MISGTDWPDPDEFERSMWEAGNAALAAEGGDRDDLAEAAGMLAGLRDLAVLWRSGAPPDPGCWAAGDYG